MNLGIRKAKGEYIVRIDAHCIYPTNYISELIFNSIKFNADNIGTIMETIPANSSVKAKVIAIALSHPLGVGNSYFRTGSSKIRQVDTVPFGCYKKEVFKNIGLYDEELIRNQDDELNGRLTQSGGKIILMPNIVLKYYARDTIKKVFSMFYQYGFFKPLVNLKLKKPATVRQFAPLLFVLAILTGLLAGLFNYLILKITLFCIGFYFFILLIISFKIIIIEKLKFISIIYFILTFFTIHWSYGWGYINGILTLIKNKIIN
jgi:glycosyltransferase involved in cell wall biosynthesis